MRELRRTFATISEDATEEDSTVDRADRRKKEYYAEKFDFGENSRITVVPAAMDSRGRWGNELKTLVKKIARMGTQGETAYAMELNRLRTGIACAHANAIGNQVIKYLGDYGAYEVT